MVMVSDIASGLPRLSIIFLTRTIELLRVLIVSLLLAQQHRRSDRLQ
jgi:hypothetical protein